MASRCKSKEQKKRPTKEFSEKILSDGRNNFEFSLQKDSSTGSMGNREDVSGSQKSKKPKKKSYTAKVIEMQKEAKTATRRFKTNSPPKEAKIEKKNENLKKEKKKNNRKATKKAASIEETTTDFCWTADLERKDTDLFLCTALQKYRIPEFPMPKFESLELYPPIPLHWLMPETETKKLFEMNPDNNIANFTSIKPYTNFAKPEICQMKLNNSKSFEVLVNEWQSNMNIYFTELTNSDNWNFGFPKVNETTKNAIPYFTQSSVPGIKTQFREDIVKEWNSNYEIYEKDIDDEFKKFLFEHLNFQKKRSRTMSENIWKNRTMLCYDEDRDMQSECSGGLKRSATWANIVARENASNEAEEAFPNKQETEGNHKTLIVCYEDDAAKDKTLQSDGFQTIQRRNSKKGRKSHENDSAITVKEVFEGKSDCHEKVFADVNNEAFNELNQKRMEDVSNARSIRRMNSCRRRTISQLQDLPEENETDHIKFDAISDEHLKCNDENKWLDKESLKNAWQSFEREKKLNETNDKNFTMKEKKEKETNKSPLLIYIKTNDTETKNANGNIFKLVESKKSRRIKKQSCNNVENDDKYEVELIVGNNGTDVNDDVIATLREIKYQIRKGKENNKLAPEDIFESWRYNFEMDLKRRSAVEDKWNVENIFAQWKHSLNSAPSRRRHYVSPEIILNTTFFMNEQKFKVKKRSKFPDTVFNSWRHIFDIKENRKVTKNQAMPKLYDYEIIYEPWRRMIDMHYQMHDQITISNSFQKKNVKRFQKLPEDIFAESRKFFFEPQETSISFALEPEEIFQDWKNNLKLVNSKKVIKKDFFKGEILVSQDKKRISRQENSKKMEDIEDWNNILNDEKAFHQKKHFERRDWEHFNKLNNLFEGANYLNEITNPITIQNNLQDSKVKQSEKEEKYKRFNKFKSLGTKPNKQSKEKDEGFELFESRKSKKRRSIKKNANEVRNGEPARESIYVHHKRDIWNNFNQMDNYGFANSDQKSTKGASKENLRNDADTNNISGVIKDEVRRTSQITESGDDDFMNYDGLFDTRKTSVLKNKKIRARKISFNNRST